MKEYKIESSKFVSDLQKARVDDCGMLKATNARVGNNGFTPGDKFTVSGYGVELFTVGNNQTAFPAIYTKEGAIINARRLMGVSSLRGYHLQGEFDNQYDAPDAKTSAKGYEPSVSKVYADCLPDITAKDVYHPKDDRFLHFLMDIESGAEVPEGSTITYLGTAVRPYIARNDSPQTAIENWQAGYQRAMSTQLWKVEAPKKSEQ